MDEQRFGRTCFRVATNGYVFMVQMRLWWWPFWFNWTERGFTTRVEAANTIDREIAALKLRRGPWRA